MADGSLLGGIAGAFIGFFVGGPAGAVKGFMYGSTIGGALDPPKGPNTIGPRLDDLKFTTSSNVAPLPHSYGTTAHKGNLFYVLNGEITEKVNKKRVRISLFKKQTVYSFEYFFTGAYAFSKGEIVEVLRIWLMGGRDLIFNATSDDLDTLVASAAMLNSKIRIYKGTDTQTPDPVMAAAVGVERCPGMVGVFYLFFDGMPLADYNNNPGQLDPKVEYTAVAGTPTDLEFIANVAADSESTGQDEWMYLHNVPYVGVNGASVWRLGTADAFGITSTISAKHYSATPDGNLVYRNGTTPAWPAGDSNHASHGKSDANVFVSTSLYITQSLASESGLGGPGTRHPYILYSTTWKSTPTSFGSAWEDAALPYWYMTGTLADVWDAIVYTNTYASGGTEPKYNSLWNLPPDNTHHETHLGPNSISGGVNGFAWTLHSGQVQGVGGRIIIETADAGAYYPGQATEDWYSEDYHYSLMFRAFLHFGDVGEVISIDLPLPSNLTTPSAHTAYCYHQGHLYITYRAGEWTWLIEWYQPSAGDFGITRTRRLAGELEDLSVVKMGVINNELVLVCRDDDNDGWLLRLDLSIDREGLHSPEEDEYGYDETIFTVMEPADVLAEFGDNGDDFFNWVSFDFNKMFYCEDGHVIQRDQILGDDIDLGEIEELIIGGEPAAFNIWRSGSLVTVATYGAPMPNVGVQFFSVGIVTQPGLVPLADVLRGECIRAGIATEYVNTDLITALIRGITVGTDRGSARNTFEQLRACYPFDCFPSGYGVKFVQLDAGTSVATISWEDLVGEVLLNQEREMDQQLPKFVYIRYFDIDLNYDPNEQFSERPLNSVNEVEINTALVLSGLEAKQMSDVLQSLYFLRRLASTFSLPPKYRYLEPSDIITLQMPLATHILKLDNMLYSASGVIDCAALRHKQSAYTSYVTYEPPAPRPDTIPSMSAPLTVLADTPVITDTIENALGISAAMTSKSTNWSGGVLFLESGNFLDELQGFDEKAVFGTCVNALAENNGTVIQREGTLIVKPYAGTFTSVSDIDFLNEKFLLAYGVNGRIEILAVQNATDNEDGTWTLDTFIRGMRRTEWATGLHLPGDYFLLINVTSVEFVELTSEELNKALKFQAAAGTMTNAIDSSVPIAMNYLGENARPLAPLYAYAVRVEDGSMTIVVEPCSRLGNQMTLSELTRVGRPIGEASLLLEIDIVHDTGTRTLSSTTGTFEYSEAMQVEDFGEVQAELPISAYQISATIGRGRVLEETI